MARIIDEMKKSYLAIMEADAAARGAEKLPMPPSPAGQAEAGLPQPPQDAGAGLPPPPEGAAKVRIFDDKIPGSSRSAAAAAPPSTSATPTRAGAASPAAGTEENRSPP